jgi:hypothetical protein
MGTTKLNGTRGLHTSPDRGYPHPNVSGVGEPISGIAVASLATR